MKYVANFHILNVVKFLVPNLFLKVNLLNLFFCFNCLVQKIPFSLISNTEFENLYLYHIKNVNLLVEYVVMHVEILKIVLSVICLMYGLIL